MSIVFLAPEYLWLALLAPVVWFVPYRPKQAAQSALRSTVILLLAIGLARPAVWHADTSERAVFVVDASESVAKASRASASAAIAEMQRTLPARVESTLVTVGAQPDLAGFERMEHVAESAGGSSISAALATAARAIPIGTRGSITLVSDGLATDRAFGDALVDIEERGIPVHTVRLAPAAAPPAVVALGSDVEWRIGLTSRVDVDVTGTVKDARVRLVEGQDTVAQIEHVDVEGRTRVTLDYEPKVAGFVALEARVESSTGASTMSRTFAVQGPLRVCYLGGRIGGGAVALQRLVGPGFAFDAMPTTDALSSKPIEESDLVVLDDAPAASIPLAVQATIARCVRDQGLGLVMSGGESSFGPGGWSDTDLAALLPVECIQKEEKRDPSTTLVLIIDTSGSMGGERIQLAKEVARLAMARLLPHDKVGIVEFYGTKRWAAPIQPASNSIELQRAINRMDAEGGTVILPAIEEAFYGLQNVETRYKHVLILTDGGVENGSFEPLLRHMAEEGMAVSTVLIGPEAHSEFLVDLANWGKGRFYSVPDRFNLPEILLKQPTSSRLPAYKPGQFALTTRGGTAWWTRIDRTLVPPIAGLVETTARPGAEVLIETADEHDPLLATWCVGLGRVTALTTEPVGPGTLPWQAWNDYGRFLARILARTANEHRASFSFSSERRGRDVYVIAHRTSERAVLPAGVLLAADGAAGSDLAFSARSDREFVAHTVADPDVEVRLRCSARNADGTADPEPEQFVVSNARADRSPELAVDPLESLDLEHLARATGGDRVALEHLASFVPRSGGATEPVRLANLAPFAFALALLVYLFEIFHRRRDRRSA